MKRHRCHQAVPVLEYRPLPIRYRDYRTFEYLAAVALLLALFCAGAMFMALADVTATALMAGRL